VFTKECIPLVPNEFTTFILSQDANEIAILLLYQHFEQLKCRESFILLLKQIYPAVVGAIINEGEPVLEAEVCQARHFMQIAVNHLE
jgi:hypothetical protein